MSAFDDLQRQLSRSVADRASATGTAAAPDAAAAADATPDAAGRRARRRSFTTRPFVLALVGLTVAGSATAATIAFKGSPSAPLEGRVPAAPPGAAGAGDARGVDLERYRIAVAPGYELGSTMWCVAESRSVGSRDTGGQATCTLAATDRSPVIVDDSAVATSRAGSAGSTNGLNLVVDGRIGGVRLSDGRVVVPRGDARLPEGFRIVIVPRPPADRAVTFLDRDGRPSAAYAAVQREPEAYELTLDRRTDPATPSAWSLSTTDPRGVRIGAARELEAPLPFRRDYNGRPFLPASDARIAHEGRQYRASYLVDAGDPDRPAAPLPGATPGRDPGTVRTTGGGGVSAVDARRAGPGWIVVRGPSPSGRREVLRALRVGAPATPRRTP